MLHFVMIIQLKWCRFISETYFHPALYIYNPCSRIIQSDEEILMQAGQEKNKTSSKRVAQVILTRSMKT